MDLLDLLNVSVRIHLSELSHFDSIHETAALDKQEVRLVYHRAFIPYAFIFSLSLTFLDACWGKRPGKEEERYQSPVKQPFNLGGRSWSYTGGRAETSIRNTKQSNPRVKPGKLGELREGATRALALWVKWTFHTGNRNSKIKQETHKNNQTDRTCTKYLSTDL